MTKELAVHLRLIFAMEIAASKMKFVLTILHAVQKIKRVATIVAKSQRLV
jgi:hypothetical protein